MTISSKICPAYFAGLRLYQKAFLAVKWSTSSSFLTSIDMWSIFSENATATYRMSLPKGI